MRRCTAFGVTGRMSRKTRRRRSRKMATKAERDGVGVGKKMRDT